METAPPFRRIAISPGLLEPTTSAATAEDTLLLWLQRAHRQGADAFMLREAGASPQLLGQLTTRLKEAAHALGAPLLLNAPYQPPGAEADGLHHKAGLHADIPHDPSIWYGRSTHSREEALAADAAGYHYVFFSPVFPTRSHHGATAQGLEALASVCAAVSIPVYALGGITPVDEATCLKAGAHGIAGIRLFIS